MVGTINYDRGKRIDFVAKGEDSDGDALTYSILVSPKQGSLTCTNKGGNFSCRYTPPHENFKDSVQFSYRAYDGKLNSRIGYVSLLPQTSPSSIVQLAVRGYQFCALFELGNVRCWGSAGNRVTLYKDPASFRELSFSSRMVKVFVAGHIGCALSEQGEMRCWSGNIESPYHQPPPREAMDFGTTLKVIDFTTSCALFESGQVKCWGGNRYGQLGLGHTNRVEHPKDSSFLDLPRPAMGLVSGLDSNCALLDSGGVICWGYNIHGQLGLGHANNIGDDETLWNMTAISLGGEPVVQLASGLRTYCALINSGSVRCWGEIKALLGPDVDIGIHGHYLGDSELPTVIDPLDLGGTMTAVAANYYMACALNSEGRVRCWGRNRYGQLGLGHKRQVGDDEAPSAEPYLALPEKMISIGVGSYSGCALSAAGRVYCWGYNRQENGNGAGLLGLGHAENIGDDETLEGLLPVKISRREEQIHPRYQWTALASGNGRVSFDATKTFAHEGVRSYAWDFGDGSSGGMGASPSHTFAGVGPYRVVLTVTDGAGQTATRTQMARPRFQNSPPFISNNQSFQVAQGQVMTFALEAGRDWNNQALTYTVATAPVKGTLSDCLNGDSDLSCRYEAPSDFTGKVTFTYRANDGRWNSLNDAMVTLTVTRGDE